MSMLPCLLPPVSDDECEINDENDPGKIGFSTRSEIEDDANLPIPVPPPPRQDVLFAAHTYNHGSLGMTPPRRQADEGYKNGTPKKNPNYCAKTPPYSNHEKKPLQSNMGEAVKFTNPSPKLTTAKHRKTSSDINGDASPSLARTRDGYDSDNLNTRARIAFARRQERTVKNSLLKKIGPAFDNLRTEGSIMEKLFGDVVKPFEEPSQPNIPPSRYCQEVRARQLVSSSLYQSDSTNLWIVTVDTNNGGWKVETSTLQAFTFPTLEEAREAAYSYAPPLLTPFDESPTCYGCLGKFAVFRRAVHCKSCGVCVCRKCAIHWPADRLPQTYNHKREPKLNVCLSCNFLSEKFQKALLEGEEEEALALYETGNLNIRCPFGKDENGEIMFPVHCAVQGGNLNLVRWLVDVHFCPVFMTQLTNSNESQADNCGVSTQPLLTSKGRSALYYAMSTQNIDLLRYLVVEKGMSLFETKDLRTSLLNLKLALERLPSQLDQENRLLTARNTHYDNIIISQNHGKDHEIIAGAHSFESEPVIAAAGEEEEDDVTTTTVNDACIICFVNVIDCVLLPCGHQICCTHCSKTLNLCPICNTKCTYRKIFKP
jgi:hypothetical protein